MSDGKPKIAFFGHFGQGNFGNESTLQAMLCRLRQLAPGAEFTCICTGPEIVAADYGITAVPSRSRVGKPWRFHNPLANLARRLLLGIPIEFYRWLKGFETLRRTDALVVPGTGLLTDAYTLFNWGPYDMFRWSVTAKLCGCKLLFASVGAGPLYSRAGRFLVRTALSLADFRSYRDYSSKRYLEGIGFRADNDPVCPDLAFSLPQVAMALGHDRNSKGRRLVVGLGLMEYAGKYSVERPTGAVQAVYLETLVEFVKWLLAREYNVRLLIGDLLDVPVTQAFKGLLKERSVTQEAGRIIDEPVKSFEEVLAQVGATDFMVATRFHNVLFSVLLNKPLISISFHHKCASLMRQMGLSDYCQDINSLSADRLIKHFCRLEMNVAAVKQMIAARVDACRASLEEQYGVIVSHICPGGEQPTAPAAETRQAPTAIS